MTDHAIPWTRVELEADAGGEAAIYNISIDGRAWVYRVHRVDGLEREALVSGLNELSSRLQAEGHLVASHLSLVSIDGRRFEWFVIVEGATSEPGEAHEAIESSLYDWINDLWSDSRISDRIIAFE
ncbi:MAG TPA: hypothetical protein PK095_07510 [Myxococcota bacterium]|nr:hypothetical protein [Myxococcota bacterium]